MNPTKKQLQASVNYFATNFADQPTKKNNRLLRIAINQYQHL